MTMTVNVDTPEKLAQLLHYYSEALAPDFGQKGAGRRGAGSEWEELTENERSRMVTATRLALFELHCEPEPAGFGEMPAMPTFAAGSEGKECGC
jgi:hypothetical protein